jgi:hypothetical protein
MTLSKLDIAKMIIGPGGSATITGDVETFDPVRDVFTVHYLNWASMDMTGATGYIIASGLGPSVRKFNAAEYKLLGGAEQPDSTAEIKPVVCQTIHTGCSYFSPLLQRMNTNKVNLKTFGTVGAHIVVLSGPLKKLSIMNGDRRFLCPILNAQRVSSSSAYLQDYVLINKEVRRSREYTALNEKTELGNSKIEKMGEGKVVLKCYDLRNYTRGLIFSYVRDETLGHIEVLDEFVCDDNLSHSEMVENYGVVLSHWIMDDRVPRIHKSHVDIAQKYFLNSRGFGDGRKVSTSIGNVGYSGEKGSGRAIPTPW